MSPPDSSRPLPGGAAPEWQDVPPPNDFAARFGTLRRRRDGDAWRYAVRVEDGHRNGAGVMHGGALAAFVDEIAGTVAADMVGRPHVTVQLETRFLRPVIVGDLLEARCEIVAVTRSMTFVEAKAFVGDGLVATASLILKASRTRA